MRLTGHLPVDTLAGLAESDEAHPHIAVCEQCRRQLQQAREALAEARRVDVPEPSPLFWELLSARVRAGIDDEAGRTATRGRSPSTRWRSLRAGKLRPHAMWAPAVAAAVVMICAVAIWLVPRGDRAGTASSTVVPSHATATSAVSRRAPDAEVHAATADLLPPSSDPSWRVIAHVAGAIQFEDSVLVQPGATDRAVAHLSVEEQQEFMRLLKSDLNAPSSQ